MGAAEDSELPLALGRGASTSGTSSGSGSVFGSLGRMASGLMGGGSNPGGGAGGGTPSTFKRIASVLHENDQFGAASGGLGGVRTESIHGRSVVDRASSGGGIGATRRASMRGTVDEKGERENRALAAKLYPYISQRLKQELRRDRERVGMITGLHS